MSRTLYLHIGSHKTGTTSIQNFLRDNTDLLFSRGFGYPVSANNLNLGGVIGKATEGDGEVSMSGAMGRRKNVLVDTITQQKTDTVIGSSEGFSYLHDADDLKEFAVMLSRHFATIKIITYLRRQDQLAVSHHQEGANPQNKPAAKLHGYSPTALPNTSDLQFRYMDYATRIGMWGDAFGDDNMNVRVYDRKVLKSGDSVADFLAIIGLGDLDPTILIEKNVSMGFIQSKVGHILNEIIENQHAKSAVMSRLPRDGKLLPRRDDARRFVEPYLEGNRRLNQRFRINDVPDLFSDDFSAYPEEGNELWTEATANATIRACAEVIESLSAGNTSFSTAELTAAAKALATSNPEASKRFMTAALAIRPNSKRLQGKSEALDGKLKRRGKRGEADEAELPRVKGQRAKKRAQRKAVEA